MQKPIEPGCLVAVLRGEIANHVGTVIERVPAGQIFITHKNRTLESAKKIRLKGDAWEVDIASDPDVIWTVPEKDLMRIDGGDADFYEVSQEVPADAFA